MGQLVAIAQRIVGWENATFLTYVYSHKTEGLVFSSAIVGASAHKTLNCTTLGHRACESLHQTKAMRILPQPAPTQRSKIVKRAFLIKVVFKNEFSRWLILIYASRHWSHILIVSGAHRIYHRAAL